MRVGSCVRVLFILGLLFALSTLHADTTVADQFPVDVQADQLQIDEPAGEHVLIGNVRIRRAGHTIAADTIRVTMQDGLITGVFGSGSPVSFVHAPEDGPSVVLEADEISYQTRTWTVVFTGNVILRKQGWQLSGDIVEYQINTRNVIATVDPIANKVGPDDQRVNLVLNPVSQ